jgi:hypothetical protein
MGPSSAKKFQRRRAHHRRILLGRFARGAVLAGILILASLALGILGYRFIAGLDWIEAVLNASMILTGMGPVAPLETNAGKLFASFYALFSGLAFVTASGILLTPMLQHILRKFHIEEKSPARKSKP